MFWHRCYDNSVSRIYNFVYINTRCNRVQCISQMQRTTGSCNPIRQSQKIFQLASIWTPETLWFRSPLQLTVRIQSNAIQVQRIVPQIRLGRTHSIAFKWNTQTRLLEMSHFLENYDKIKRIVLFVSNSFFPQLTYMGYWKVYKTFQVSKRKHS